MTSTRASRTTYWDRQALTYDTRTSGAERRFFADSRSWVCSRARGLTLELAIGTGANLPHYPDGVDLTGVDRSTAMLAQARARADRLGRPVALQRADATALPYPSDTFTSVTCTFAMCCIDDERAALSEALRVLRPGGRLLLADHVASPVWPLLALQHLVDLVSVPRQGEHYTRRPLTTVQALGMTVVESERLTWGAIERLHAHKDG